MTNGTDILVVGGYGMVGSRIAARLASHFPGQVAIAGRDQHRAAALSSKLGFGTRARRVDANDAASIDMALEGVGTVMMCVAQRAILLSLGDEYGPDSLHHVLESVTQPFSVFENGRARDAVPFSDGPEMVDWLRIVFRTWGGFMTGFGVLMASVAMYMITSRAILLSCGLVFALLVAFGRFLASNITTH